MSERNEIEARLARAGGTEAVTLERRSAAGVDVVSAVIERQGRGFRGLYVAHGLDRAGRDELREAVSGGRADLIEVPLSDARQRLGRAVLAHRIAGRQLPEWAQAGHELLGDLRALTDAIDDVYLCAACERPLAPAAQIALARQAGQAAEALACPGCRGDLEEDREAERLVAWAWLRLLAGEPRKTLVLAARAEALRVDSARLDALRGAAMLKLQNPVQATGYLRRAVEREPADHWVRARLVEALTCAGYLASAGAELARLVSRRPALANHGNALAAALADARRAADGGDPLRLRAAAESFGAAA